MMDKVKKLIVKYNNKLVGYLVDLDNSRIAFQYNDEWIENGFSISPFSLPLSTKIYENKKDYFGGLYGVFSDSLPDGWGELLVRRMLAKKGINPDRVSPLTKLTMVSGNGLGALMYEPCQTAQSDNTEFDLDIIAEESRKILEDEGGNVDLDKIFEFGGSSGGARPKAHIKIDDEYWIVKFPSSFDPKNIGEIEFQANQLAKKCGINVNEFRLFNSKKHTGYFGAKRFDRGNIKKIHMISLSSLLETTHRIPSLDYLHLFQVIQKICVDQENMYEAYRRMCFNVLYGNKDDHGKNFAFLYDENLRGYKLSPAYDITKTPNKTEHEMTVNGAGIPKENDLLEVAKIMKLSFEKCKTIIVNIKKVLKDNLKS